MLIWDNPNLIRPVSFLSEFLDLEDWHGLLCLMLL